MRTSLFATLSIVGLLAVGSRPAAAQLSNSGIRVRVWGASVGRYVLSDNAPYASPGFGTVELQVDGSAIGFGGDVEYKFNRWIGLDAGIGYSSLTVDFTTTTAPGTTLSHGFVVMPAMLALDIHLISTKRVDIWAGPEISEVMFPTTLTYIESTTNGGGTFTYVPQNVFSKKGFFVGTDIALTRNILLNLGMRWQDADSDGDDHLTVDPAFITVGFRLNH